MVVLDQGTLTVDPVTFGTASGKLSAQLVLAPISSTAYRMKCLANVQGIHIDNVFTEFENFGQTFCKAPMALVFSSNKGCPRSKVNSFVKR